MDYPRTTAKPTHISTYTRWISGNAVHSTASPGVPAASTWGTANKAVFIPMFIPWEFTIARGFSALGSVVGGNNDIGIYTPGGALIWSTGSVAQSGAGILYSATGLPILLTPGRYYAAFAHNSVTANRVLGVAVVANTGRLSGVLTMSSAFPLPATAVFEAYDGVGIPLFGFTSTETGF